MSKFTKIGLVILVILVAIFAGLYYYLQRQEMSEIAIEASQLQETPPPHFDLPPQPKEFNVKLGTQKAGRVLVSDYLEATASGWVALFSDKGGNPGDFIEAAIPPFEKLASTGESFLLNNELLSNNSYWAIIYVDNGDLSFNMEDDQPALNLAGELVRQQFSVK